MNKRKAYLMLIYCFISNNPRRKEIIWASQKTIFFKVKAMRFWERRGSEKLKIANIIKGPEMMMGGRSKSLRMGGWAVCVMWQGLHQKTADWNKQPGAIDWTQAEDQSTWPKAP